jgi:hypothetical protein
MVRRYWAIILWSAMCVSCGGGTTAPDKTGKPILHVQHDAMIDWNRGWYDLDRAFVSVGSVSKVEPKDDEIALMDQEYLIDYPGGEFGYTMDHRQILFADTMWQIYVLSANKYDPWSSNPENTPFIAGNTLHSPDTTSEAMSIVYLGAVKNLYDRTQTEADTLPPFGCWRFPYERGCRAATLHEIAHCFDLADVPPSSTTYPCDEPWNCAIMVLHWCVFRQNGYSADEILSLSNAGRP